MHARRTIFTGGLAASALAALLLAGCASGPGAPSAPSLEEAPPVVMVHGNGDYAAAWLTTLWRFESNGWPSSRLHAIEVPYPSAQADDNVAQPGVTSAAEHMAYLKKEVEAVLARTGASKVVLFANSRGGNAIRNYIQSGGGADKVSHAILGGTPNHGVWAIKGSREGNEFSGTGPFLTRLNAPKNAAGDEVTGPVKWMTIRSDNNDKFAKPDGLWIGARGTATNVTAAGPELKGAQNVVIPRIDHRETSFSPAAFLAACKFIKQRDCKDGIDGQTSVLLNGRITGMGAQSDDPRSGNSPNNLPVPGSRIDIYAIDPATGERKGAAVHSKVADANGYWGPVVASPNTPYEFVVTAPSYATTHVYRSGFARSSDVIHFRPERIADADKGLGTIVNFIRPRGYFDPDRDRMAFDGKALPGVPVGVGAGESRSVLKLAAAPVRSISAEFNGEKLVGRTWPVTENRVVVLELTQ
jgi:triacylglycerol lipase